MSVVVVLVACLCDIMCALSRIWFMSVVVVPVACLCDMMCALISRGFDLCVGYNHFNRNIY